METTQKYTIEEAAKIIIAAARDMRTRKITADAYGAKMRSLRESMFEADYTAAKFRAAANDR